MQLPFMPFIEEAGNRLLRLDPETLRRLGDLQGRVVCIEFRGLGHKLYLHPSESGFRLATECDQPPAVTLRGTLATFGRLGLGAETETLKAGALDIEGDAALGQRLRSEGTRSPFEVIAPAHTYASLDDARAAVRTAGRAIRR